ncbi:MAG: SDR family NAD(P)-dependent oxidoreductase [Salinivirgaceae bacterium]
MDKQIIVITGASSGIGKALALTYAGKSTELILGALNKEELDNTARECEQKGSTTRTIEFDLCNADSTEAFTNAIKNNYTTVDRLVHVSGISQRAMAEDTSLEVDRRIMEINYFGAIKVTKALLPLLKAGNGGKIGVTSSISGKFGFPLRSAYAASKFALVGFFESLRLEHFRDNITVTLLYPGRINTPISLSALNGRGKAQGIMDPGQATGMPVKTCAAKMKKAIEKNKKDAYIGGKEILMVYFKKYLPALFYKIAKKTNPR